MFSSSFMAPMFYVQVTHFIFLCGIRGGQVSFFCMLLSSFPNTICGQDCSILIIYFWLTVVN